MALCDRFDAARGERDRRVRFTITTLGRLTGQAPESASFASSTTSALENISTLTAHSDQIRYLRQAVLALAVRGRLVRQDPSDVYFQSLLHRIHAASDLHRLKTSGIGRLDRVECPTCHRDLDPSTFGLTIQSADSVAMHIEALKRDRDLIRRNIEATEAARVATQAELERVDIELREAERILSTVTSAAGRPSQWILNLSATFGHPSLRPGRLY